MTMKHYFLFLTTLLFFSCKEEEPIEVIDNSWKLFSEVKYQAKNASDCSVHNDLMIIRSLNSLSYINSNHQLLNQYPLFSNLSYGYKKFPTNSGYYLTLSDELYPSRIECRPFLNLTASVSFDFNQDSTILGLERQLGLYEPVYISSPSGQFLFKVKNNLNQSNSLLVLADINKPKNYQRIQLNSKPNYTSLHFYSSGKFYYSSTDLEHGLYTVDTLGHVEKISAQGFETIVESNGVFYALGSSFDLFISFDKGQTWQQSTLKAPSGNIVNLGQKTFFLDEEKIIEVVVVNNKIELITYNSKGMEGNAITALCNFNGRYYCATKSGVFYLKGEDFKPEK
jgi:hypothetical protein